jgi:NAD(P)-dependent dehydrogenase (short-subunit alcohol dehydrogenase family)
MPYAAFFSSNVAVVTGGASGIGLAAAKRFIAMNLKVCIADVDEERLDAAISDGGEQNLLVVPADISRLDEVRKLEKTVDSAADVAPTAHEQARLRLPSHARSSHIARRRSFPRHSCRDLAPCVVA